MKVINIKENQIDIKEEIIIASESKDKIEEELKVIKINRKKRDKRDIEKIKEKDKYKKKSKVQIVVKKDFQITQITKQIKRDRYNIFLNDKYAFSLFPITVSLLKIKEGKKLDKKDIEKILLEDIYEKIKENCFNKVSIRPRSEKEIIDYIKEQLRKKIKKDFLTENLSQEIQERILKLLKKYNYINDIDFTDWWIKQRIIQNKGPAVIKRDLFQKGIDSKIVNQKILEVDFQEGYKKTKEKAEKKYRKEKDNYKKKSKIYRYILSRGFYPEF